MATTLTVLEKTRDVVTTFFPDLKISYIESYYDHPSYIDALANSIKRELMDKKRHIYYLAMGT